MTRPEGDPRPVGDLINTLISGRGWDERMRFGRLRDEWASVVGAEVAARSTPVALNAGVLSIRADGAAWATELTLLGCSATPLSSRHRPSGAVCETDEQCTSGRCPSTQPVHGGKCD